MLFETTLIFVAVLQVFHEAIDIVDSVIDLYIL